MRARRNTISARPGARLQQVAEKAGRPVNIDYLVPYNIDMIEPGNSGKPFFSNC